MLSHCFAHLTFCLVTSSLASSSRGLLSHYLSFLCKCFFLVITYSFWTVQRKTVRNGVPGMSFSCFNLFNKRGCFSIYKFNFPPCLELNIFVRNVDCGVSQAMRGMVFLSAIRH